MTQYFTDAKFDEQNRTLFAFASYNAGPGNISKMRKEAEKRGLDPDKWFNNVEIVTAEKSARGSVSEPLSPASLPIRACRRYFRSTRAGRVPDAGRRAPGGTALSCRGRTPRRQATCRRPVPELGCPRRAGRRDAIHSRALPQEPA